MGANFSVTQFKEAVAQSGGFARPIFFDCQITCQSMETAVDSLGNSLKLNNSDTVVCKAVNIPEETIDTVDIKYFTRSVPVPGARQYQPITLTFYNTVNYKLRRYFETWINLLNSRDENTKQTAPLSNITATLKLSHWNNDGKFKLSWQTAGQLATAAVSSNTNRIASTIGNVIGNSLGFNGPIESNNPKIYAFTFENAYPTSIGALTFSQEDDTTFQTFDVTFKYLKMVPGLGNVTTTETIYLPDGSVKLPDGTIFKP